jgi:4-hydroxy-3-polyprenylbenzoate decarboxylase
MEDCYLAYATERLFLPLLRTILPEIVDYHLPWEGVFHNIVVAAIQKEFPGHAAKVMNALWGSGQMSFAKAVVLIDDKDLLTQGGRLLRHILDTIDLKADITITEGILDVLDHSAPQGLFGAKIGIDATARITGETPRPMSDPSPKMPDQIVLRSRLQDMAPGLRDVRVMYPESRRPLILAAVQKNREINSARYLSCLNDAPVGAGILVLYDAHIDLNDNALALWKVFNNVDPRRDIRFTRWGAIIDATKKGPADGHTRPWPDDIAMAPELRRLVDEKFPEIGKL